MEGERALSELTNEQIIDQIESYNIEPKTTNIINIVNYGAKDGQVVNTSFENAFSDTNLDSGGIVYVPAGHYYIDGATHNRSETYFYEPDNGIKIPSNITLFLNPDAILETKSNSNFCSTQFKIDNASNVNIIGGSFVGDRKTHVIDQTTKFQRQDHYAGECGFGIVTAGAKNVRITHTSFTGFWGDGINVFYDEDLVVDNSEIEIDHVTFDSNRRQGISVENGDQLKIHHNTFKNTGIAEQLNGQLDNSTPPRSGIDLEPADGHFDGKLKHVTNVTIENNNFDCNVGSAVMINVTRNDRTPLSVKGVLIQHNTVNNNSKWMPGQFHICGGTDVEIAYNKISKNTTDPIMTGKGLAIWVGWTVGLNIHNNYAPGGSIKLEPFDNLTTYANQTVNGVVQDNYALGMDISDDWYSSVTQSNNLQSSDAPESFIQLTGIDPNSDKDDTHINPTPDENPFNSTPSTSFAPSSPSSSTPSTPSSPSSSTPPKPVEPAKYNLTISLIDRYSSQVKTNYKITKTEGEPITITLGMVESLLPQHYTFVPHALDNFPQTITLNGDSDTTVFIIPIIDTINNTKQVTRTIIGQWFDTNGNIISSSTLKVQTAEFTTPTYVNEVTGQRTIGNSSPDNTTFPAYAIPPSEGYTADTAEVSSLTVFSTSNDTLVTVKYNKNRPPIVVEPPKPTTITNNFTVSVALPKLDKQTAFSISIKGSGVLHQISNADHTKLVTYDFNLNPNWYQRVEFMLDKQDAQNLELTFQNATDSVYLKLPKLEYGSTSTPYSE